MKKNSLYNKENKIKDTILIVDDTPHNIKLLGTALSQLDYEVAVANNGKDAISFVEKEKVDLILLDIMMPEMDGYEVCKIIKNNIKIKEIPIIFLTAKSDGDDIARGFEYGAVDYVTKPFNVAALKARIKTHLELYKARVYMKEYNTILEKKNDDLQKANDIINDQNMKLANAMEKLTQLMSVYERESITDSLTGLPNRRYIREKIESELARYKRKGNNFSIVMGDIDFFKKINDTHGHDCGDFVLKEISNLLKKTLRETDSVARWGGEEFLFLLPETNLNDAYNVAEKMRKIIEEKELIFNDLNLNVTMTFGVAEFNSDLTIDDIIKNADSALYDGKTAGRNQVVKNI